MASWAKVAKLSPAAPAAVEAPAPSADERVAIVDANAIISGLRLEGLADRFVTVPEVLAEVRDKQSRQFMASLTYGLEAREPAEESLRAGEQLGTGLPLARRRVGAG